MKKILSIIFLALTVSMTVNAQEFLDNLRDKQDGKGKVNISQSKEIEDLLKAPAKQQTPQTNPQQATTQQVQTKQKTAATSASKTTGATSAPSTPLTKKTPRVTMPSTTDIDDNTTPTVDTQNLRPRSPEDQYGRKKVMRKSYRMPGYRIQVYSGGHSREDKQKAFNAGKIIKMNFPDQPVYAHFKSPSWKCRMGNFKSQYEAQKILAQVKRLGFPQATIVKETIQVQY